VTLSPQPTARRTNRPASPSPSRSAGGAGRGRAAAAPPAGQRRFPIALITGIALAVGLIAVLIFTVVAGGDDGPLEVGTPSVADEALAPFDPAADDPAVGLPIPEVSGADFDGAAVAITRDGRAKMILFVAHWCSVCRQEVPLIMDWLPGADLPDGIDLYTVSTGVRRDQPNYPASEWLADEGWTLPVIMDDEERSVAEAFGLRAYPYWVFVDADGAVRERAQGYMTTEDLERNLAELSQA
jgi:thiol-disulfide isomerase/thioredoxin